MRKELRRSLFAAAFAGVALAGCGGNSSSSTTGSGVPAPAPSPSPSPSPTPASAGSYLLAGRAGGTTAAVANIPFADIPQGPSAFGLSYFDQHRGPAAILHDVGDQRIQV